MKAQRAFGLALAWPRITTVFLIDVGVLALASHWPDAWQTGHTAWWVGVAVAAVVTILAVVTYRRIPLASALAVRVRDRFVDPEAMLAAGRAPAINHQRRFGRDMVGVRECQSQLVAVIAVDAPDDTPSGRHRHREALLATLPVETVAAGLRQFDVRLDGIDIVSVETRRSAADASSAPDHPEPAVDHYAVEQRETWLVLRMDPQHNVGAVAARDSVASTLTAAAERLAQHLDGRRCTARPLTADEIADVDTAVLAGLQPAHLRRRRRILRRKGREEPAGYVASFWVSPRDITSKNLVRLWSPDTDATVMTIRLIPRRGGTEISAWVRYHSSQPLPKDVWTGLNRLTGRQLAAVCASLPTPGRRLPLVVPGRELRDGEQLAAPAGRAARRTVSEVGAQP